MDAPGRRYGADERLVESARDADTTRVVVDANKHALDFYRTAGFEIEAEVALEHGTAFRMSQSVAR